MFDRTASGRRDKSINAFHDHTGLKTARIEFD